MLVEENGGIVKSGVAKGLNYLVSDDKDSSSSKMIKAKSLGITLISSEEFLEMIDKK
jgi:NAD-dependent DNA ligase